MPKPARRPLRNAEAVALFFAAKPGVSDLEAAKRAGVPEDLVWSHRDPTSRIPYKRHLLRRIVNRHDHKTIVAYFFPPTTYRPPAECPSCGAATIKWGKDRNERPRAACKPCRKTFSSVASRKKPIPRLRKRSLLLFLDAIAAGRPLRNAYSAGDLCKAVGERLVFLLLTLWGEHERKDWRPASQHLTPGGSGG